MKLQTWKKRNVDRAGKNKAILLKNHIFTNFSMCRHAGFNVFEISKLNIKNTCWNWKKRISVYIKMILLKITSLLPYSLLTRNQQIIISFQVCHTRISTRFFLLTSKCHRASEWNRWWIAPILVRDIVIRPENILRFRIDAFFFFHSRPCRFFPRSVFRFPRLLSLSATPWSEKVESIRVSTCTCQLWFIDYWSNCSLGIC